MMDRRRKQLRWEGLLLACASMAAGCGGPGPGAQRSQHGTETEAVRWRAPISEPRRLDEPVQPTGFQAIHPSEVPQPDPVSRRFAGYEFDGVDPALEGVGNEPSERPQFGSSETSNLDSGDPPPALDLPSADADAAWEPAVSELRLIEPLPAVTLDLPDAAGSSETAQTPSAQSPSTQSLGIEPALASPAAQGVVRSAPRSAEMDTVSKHAEVLVQQGFRLAERGATFAARKHFFEALGMIASSLDVEQPAPTFSPALQAGRMALVEARDFAAATGGDQPPVDLQRLVSVHRTPVLKGEPLDRLSPIVAQQRYYTFAQQQLTLAAGQEPVGSLALYGLGKTARQAQSQQQISSLASLGEQVACYQAALMTDVKNFRASNELGVVLADNGRLEAARDLFLRSLSVTDEGTVWKNLALVHARLGETDLAAQADRRAELALKARPRNITGDNIRWVDPDTFAQAVPPGEGLIQPNTTSKATASKTTTRPEPPPLMPETPTAKKSTAWWPWSRNSQR